MEIHSIPCISTAHLTQEVAEQLSALGNDNPWVTCAPWEHGYFICTQGIENKLMNEVEVPQCLLDIKKWLSSKAFPCSEGKEKWDSDWVRLDQSADQVDDLPAYEW